MVKDWWDLDDFWSYTSDPVKTRFIKQGVFFFLRELGGHLNDIKGLTHSFTSFTYVGMFYLPSSSLGEKASLTPNSYQRWLV